MGVINQLDDGFGISIGGGGSAFVGLLDTYSGAAAAYSVRLLSSTYSGALVEIRRSSDNAVKDFYPDANNELSLTSEDGSGTSLSTWIGSDDGFVRTWYDQSGNANNAQQTTTSNQPQLITSGALNTINGKPIIKPVNGTSEFIFTYITGLKFSFNTISVSRDFSILYGDRTSGVYEFVALNGDGTRPDNGNVSYFKNGAAYAPSDRNTVYDDLINTQTQITCNSTNRYGQTGYNYNPNYGMMDCQELVIYSSDKTSDRAGIETNINDYFTIY